MNVDDCVDAPCKNGGTCIDEINSFRCKCENGEAEGIFNTRRVLSGSVDREGFFLEMKRNVICLVCPAGYDGATCEENIDDCRGVNCNNGVCVDGVNDFSCRCRAGSCVPGRRSLVQTRKGFKGQS